LDNTSYYAGVDIGGTKIASIVCNEQGQVLAHLRDDTHSPVSGDLSIKRIADLIRATAARANIPPDSLSAVGVSAPGPLNVASGTIIHVPVLKWTNMPVRDLLAAELGVPVLLENDGTAAAYGEYLFGAGKDVNNLAFICMGTGIGGGIVINGTVYRGRHDHAGEFGHICVEKNGRLCACGNKGCLEAYASGTNITKIAREVFAQTGLYTEDAINAMDCMAFEKLARAGDPLALSIWNEVGQKLGLAISIVVQSLDPDIVVIGGGVSRALDLIYDTVVQSTKNNIFAILHSDLKIAAAQLGDHAGALGAAFLARGERT
jgi:glucokinase